MIPTGAPFCIAGSRPGSSRKSFVLADGVDVGEARIENGLLHVDLSRKVPQSVVQNHQDPEELR